MVQAAVFSVTISTTEYIEAWKREEDGPTTTAQLNSLFLSFILCVLCG